MVTTANRKQAVDRENMVAHVAERGVTDSRVLGALRSVPRHEFVSADAAPEAYGDFPLPIGSGQTISQPLMVGLMTQSLELTGSEIALEIGTGSGYQTAILATLCRMVVTVERYESLSQEARERLQKSGGFKNIRYAVGDGTEGYAPLAPYDAIIVTAGAPQIIPPPLIAQLKRGGRMVIPLGTPRIQELTVVRKRENGTIDRSGQGDCMFVPLIGKYGWDLEDLDI